MSRAIGQKGGGRVGEVTRRVTGRAFVADMVHLGGRWLVAGAVAALVMCVAAWWLRLPGLRVPLVAACLLAASGAAVLIAYGRRWSALRSAIETDQRLGLRGRLTNAMELAGVEGAFAGLARQSGEAAASGVRVGSAVPVRFGRGWVVLPVLVAGAVAMAVMPPRPTEPSRDQSMAADERERAEAIERISAAVPPEDGAGDDMGGEEDTVARSGLTPEDRAAIDEVLRDLESGGIGADDAAESVASTLDEAADRAEQEARVEEQGRDELERALESLSTDDAELSDELVERLREGDLAGARDAAAELAQQAGELPDEQRRQLAEELRSLSEDLDALAQQQAAAEAAEAAREQQTPPPPPDADPMAAAREAERRAEQSERTEAQRRAREQLERLRDAARQESERLDPDQPSTPEQPPGEPAGDTTGDQREQQQGEQREGTQGGERGSEPGDVERPSTSEQGGSQADREQRAPGATDQEGAERDAAEPRQGEPGEQPTPQAGEQTGEQVGEPSGQEQGGEAQPQPSPAGEQPAGQTGERQDAEEQVDPAGDAAPQQPQPGQQQPGQQQPGGDQQQPGEQPGQQPGQQPGADPASQPGTPPGQRDVTQGQEGSEPGGEPGGGQSLSEAIEDTNQRSQGAEQMRRRADELRRRSRDLRGGEGQGSPTDQQRPGGEGTSGGTGAPGGERPVPGDLTRARDELVDARRAPESGEAGDDDRVLADWFGDGAEGAGNAVERERVIRDAARSAERAVEDRAVPRRYRDLVRDVFERYRSRTGGTSEAVPLGEDAPRSPPAPEGDG